MDTMAKVLLERETVEGDIVNALLDDEWDSYVAEHPEAAEPKREAPAAKPSELDEDIATEAAEAARAAVAAEAADGADDADAPGSGDTTNE